MKNAFNFRPWMVLAVLLTYSLGTWAQSITLKGIVKDDFGESINSQFKAYYAIANNESLTNKSEYEDFMNLCRGAFLLFSLLQQFEQFTFGEVHSIRSALISKGELLTTDEHGLTLID